MIINRKRAIILLIAIGIILCLSGCCSHEWTDATCTSPKTCAECGEIEGEALEHTWVEAICTMPKHCDVCGETTGDVVAHTWIEATCAMPKHCDVCGETTGKASGHIGGNYITTKEPTLVDSGTKEKFCDICGESFSKSEIRPKIPQIIGTTFNFTDKELIEWANSWLNGRYFIDGSSALDMGDDIISYKVEYGNNEDGSLLLKHNGGDDVSAIMVYFDDVVVRRTLALLLGEKINIDYIYEDAATMATKNAPYFCDQMIAGDLRISGDKKGYLLITQAQWRELVSSLPFTHDDWYVGVGNDEELYKYAYNMWDYLIGEGYGASWYISYYPGEGYNDMKTFRGIMLGMSTEEDVIAAYGHDKEFTFNKNTDVVYGYIKRNGDSDQQEALADTKKVLVYNFDGQYQISMHIDVTGYVDCIAYLNGKYY